MAETTKGDTRMPFEMQIVEAFQFRDGTTVLVGPVTGDETLIKAGSCELLAGGKRHATVSLEGEMLPDGLRVRREYRAVSTQDSLELDREELARGGYRLVRSRTSHEAVTPNDTKGIGA
jgi:hypothetical protein